MLTLTKDKMQPKIIPQERALDYIMGGNSTFTLVTESTRYTYKIIERVIGDGSTIYAVMVLCGPDNTSNYRKFATIKEVNGMPKLELIGRTTNYIEYFELIKKLYYSLLFNNYEQISAWQVWHTGRCSRCGRLLTVPESIEKGIGPECESRVNAFIDNYSIL